MLVAVILTVQLQIKPTAEQKLALEATMRTCNAAADWISERGFATGAFSRLTLHARFYKDVRELFNISAQAACRIFAKVADAYALGTTTQRRFRPYGAVAYDARNLKLYIEDEAVSIWTTGGREKIPYVCGNFQRNILNGSLVKQCDLVRRRDGRLFVHVVVAFPDVQELKVSDVLGVDLGIAVIAADSDGKLHCGKHLNQVRLRSRALRSKLQKKGTKSAKRLLKKRSGKERRFAADTNHCISKQIVSLAKRAGRGIAIENLDGILTRIRARKAERTTLHTWAFAKLGAFIAYKAKRVGVPLMRIDPRYTSQRCSACGHTEKSNRRSRDTFACKACGFSIHADTNGARNIRLKGLAVLGAGNIKRPDAEAITHGEVRGHSQLRSQCL